MVDHVDISKKRRVVAGVWWTGFDRGCDDAVTYTCSDVC